MAMIRDLNASGLTASSGTCPDEFVPIFRSGRRRAAQQAVLLPGRDRRSATTPRPSTKPAADRRSEAVPGRPLGRSLRLRRGVLRARRRQHGGAEGDTAAGRVRAVGPHRARGRKSGMPLHSHTTLDHSFDGFLKQIEEINKEYPGAEPALGAHPRRAADASAARAHEEAGSHAAVQPRATIMGGIYPSRARRPGVRMPAFSTIQDSGMMWGLGTDAFEVNQYRPFTTLSFAVTGKMVGGTVVNRSPSAARMR